jgi:cytochrome bd-type quinol oxidase subunit 2
LALIADSAGLFLFDDPLVRLAILTAVVVAVIVVEFRFPRYRTARSFLAVILILLLVNAAFRSLYPLLLDPHSLFGPVGAQ